VYHEPGKKSRYESWNLAYILVPLHHKIRFSFAGLREVSLNVVAEAHAGKDFLRQTGAVKDSRYLSVENWIVRSTKYVEGLLADRELAERNRVLFLCKRVPLSRYVGVVRISAKEGLESIDVLVDTTSTRKNANLIGVFPLKSASAETRFVAAWVAERLRTFVIGPRVRAPRGGGPRHRR
jgi:hypothetical protein